jgi:hypothetical protein
MGLAMVELLMMAGVETNPGAISQILAYVKNLKKEAEC